MMDATKKILEAAKKLQKDFDCILEQYAFLKQENELLQKKNTELYGLIEENETNIHNLESQIEHIKIAKNIVNNKNKKESKQMLNELIKQIDACIEILE